MTGAEPLRVPSSSAAPDIESGVADEDDPDLQGLDDGDGVLVKDVELLRDPSIVPPPLPSDTAIAAGAPKSAVLDWSGYKDGEPPAQSPDSKRGSSLSTETHIAIDKRLQDMGIKLPHISEIDLPVLRNLSSMIIYGKWIPDESKLVPALAEFIHQLKPGQNLKDLSGRKSSTMVLQFFRELKALNEGAAAKLRADKEGKSPAPVSKR